MHTYIYIDFAIEFNFRLIFTATIVNLHEHPVNSAILA